MGWRSGWLGQADGSLFAWNNGSEIQVASTATRDVIQRIPRSRTLGLKFSPDGSQLATWENYAVRKGDAVDATGQVGCAGGFC